MGGHWVLLKYVQVELDPENLIFEFFQVTRWLEHGDKKGVNNKHVWFYKFGKEL